MAGTHAGAVKMWEERRRKYGSSGRRPKADTAPAGKKTLSAASKLPVKVLIDDVEHTVSIYDAYRVANLKAETAQMVYDLGHAYRSLPKVKESYIQDIYKQRRSKLQRWVRQRKAALPILEENARRITNKRHGRRNRV
jgi:hypothetical protein